MRGVIWYQGETNEATGYQYRGHACNVQDWRKLWGQGDFPFLYVQIAPYKAKQTEPTESALAEVRESQLLTLSKSPNTAMVVTMDFEAKPITVVAKATGRRAIGTRSPRESIR